MKKLLIGALMVTLVPTACSPSRMSPEEAKSTLTAALEALSRQKAATEVVTLVSDAASLRAAASGGKSSLTDDAAAKLLSSSLTITGSRGSGPAQSAFSIRLRAGGSDVFEMRFVDQVLYLRADFPALAKVLNLPAGEADKAKQLLQGPGMEPFADALEGKWVGLGGLAQVLSRSGVPIPSPGPSQEAQQAKLADAGAKLLQRSASVTDAGEEAPGRHLVAAVNLRTFFEGYAGLLGGLVPALPGASEIQKITAKAPDKPLLIDFWVKGGSIVRVEADFVKISRSLGKPAPAGVKRLALRIEVSKAAQTVSAPQDATVVDLATIFANLLSQAMQRGFSGGVQRGSVRVTRPPIPAFSFPPSLLRSPAP